MLFLILSVFLYYLNRSTKHDLKHEWVFRNKNWIAAYLIIDTTILSSDKMFCIM